MRLYYLFRILSTLFKGVIIFFFFFFFFFETFGARLQAIRQKKGLTQGELGQIVGLKAAAISKYEKNTASPNVETLTKLCQALEVSSDWLLGLEPPVPVGENGEILTKAPDDPLASRIAQLPDEAKDRVMGYLDALGY